MTIFYTLLTISTVGIAIFLFVWMYVRWQKIARNRKEDWHMKAFLITGALAIILVIATTAYWLAVIK